MWWPAQTPKSSYLGETRRLCFVVACPSPKIVLSRRDKAILLVVACPNPKIVLSRRSKIALSRRDKTILGLGSHYKAKSPYLAETGRFWGLGRPPQSKIALSAQILQKSSCLGETRRFCFVLACPNPKSSYLGKIRRLCFVVACPNPKIVLSRRDKAILLCGGLPKPQNRPISAR